MTSIDKPESTKPETKRPALGKGFNSLLGLGEEPQIDIPSSIPGEKTTKTNAVVSLKIDDIKPNPNQPRKIFEDDALQALTRSVKVDGVIQPIIVAKGEVPGQYMLVAGERRWRASKLAGKDTVPAIVRDGSPETLLRVALIENIQRADLNIIEEAEAYQSLISDFGLTQEQCAAKVGKDRSTVANALRLLSLPREIQDDLTGQKLTMGHGRAVLALNDKKLMLRARDIVIKRNLNVRQTEQLCKSFAKGNDRIAGAESASKEPNADLEYIADALRSHLRTKVKVSGTNTRGRIEIAYFSAAELERLVSAIGVKVE